MEFITTLLGIPLGYIMYACYYLTNNYALSLLIFTIITRLILIPFTIKQQKSTVKMQMIQPELNELQKKYKGNKEKLNEEMMKLYSRVGYNPMSGCLPLLIQFPILFGLIDVIYKPLSHILRFSSDTIKATSEFLAVTGDIGNKNTIQLSIIKAVKNGVEGISSVLSPEQIASIQDLKLNMLGVDLMLTPSTDMFKTIFSDFNPVLLIPIFAGITSFLMSIITTRNTPTALEGSAGASMKGMMYTMPIFSTVFTFSVPAGVGLYWCFSNVIAAIQSIIMNKFYNPKEAAEKAKLELEERREKERLLRIEEKKNNPTKAVSQKEINRKKLADARKRDAEKYGEEYVEVDDGDLQ